MDTSELVSKAAEYTEKFVDAAMPVAKKAYEIGLLTIQIDAISSIIVCSVVLGSALLGMRFLHKHRIRCSKAADEYNTDKSYHLKDWYDFSAFNDIGYFATWCLSTAVAIPPAIGLLNVWLWVKLFKPELWLAYAAIQKVLEVASK